MPEGLGLEKRLTRNEDDELRRLHWMSQIGMLSHGKRERFVELRLRDRRKEIRPPREFADQDLEIDKATTARRWLKFLSR